MARPPAWKILYDMLNKAPGKALTLREIHLDGWIQNVPDAKMRANKHGENLGFRIETEYLHANPKIASYVLHEKEQSHPRRNEKRQDQGFRLIELPAQEVKMRAYE